MEPNTNPGNSCGLILVAGKKGICEACFESGLHVVSTEKSQRQSARGSQCMVRRWFSNHPNGFGSYLLRRFAVVSCKTCKPSPLPSKTLCLGPTCWRRPARKTKNPNHRVPQKVDPHMFQKDLDPKVNAILDMACCLLMYPLNNLAPVPCFKQSQPAS